MMLILKSSFGRRAWCAVLFLLPFALPSLTAAEKAAPSSSFEVIYGLIRSNLTTTSGAELDRAAIQGLLKELQGQVLLVPAENGNASKPGLTLGKTSVYDDAFAYLRVVQVEAGLAGKITAAVNRFQSKSALKGLVLDLRYARGTDYASAAQVADLFLLEQKPLLKWGDNTARSTAKKEALNLPVVVLVNHQTRGAAEALAGAMRQAEIALVIGNKTAGEAHVFKELPLSDGQRLRIAAARVLLGNDEPIATGISPDINVTVSPADEKAYFADAFKILPRELAQLEAAATNTAPDGSIANRTPRRRLNEAELVRMQREGQFTNDENRLSETSGESNAPSVRDPVLARGLDLLKGLAIVRPRF